MKKRISIIIFLILSFTAQQQELNDSLKAIKKNDSLKAITIINQHKGDTTEVNALFHLSLLETTMDSSRAKFAEQGLALAQKIKYKKGEADCYFSLGFRFSLTESWSQSIPYYYNALRIYTDIDDFSGIASVHITLYGLYQGIGDDSSSLSHLLTGLEIVETYKVTRLKMGPSDQIIQFYLAELGLIYLQRNQLDSALIYVQKAIDQNHMVNGSPWDYPIYLLGSIQRQKGNYEQALALYRTAINLAKKNQIFSDTLQVFSGMSTLFKMQDKLDSAIHYAQEVVQSKNPDRQSKTFFEAVYNLAIVYKLTGDKDSALKYVEKYHELKDSAYNIQKNREIQNFTFNEQLKNQEMISAQVKYKSQVQFYTALGGLLVMLFIAGVLWKNDQNRKKAYALLQNQKVETEIQKKRVEDALEELKTTQSQLIQSEKMASLGELTAGIAHEIQNPLNFVNNFTDVNTELIDEAEKALDQDKEETRQLLGTIKGNEEKIRYHGQRAGAIVKSMLQHSRTSTGQKEPTDLNALCDEYLRPAYHGLRAKDKDFHAALETDFDPLLEKMNIIPQDIGRVLLNLYNNAFYACTERSRSTVFEKMKLANPHSEGSKNLRGEGPYEPVVTVSTKRIDGKVEIHVKDNGIGMPEHLKEKIFQPFFTTRPTGQGTGLGLSLSYDIVKAHGGELKVETKESAGSTFIISLPVNT